MSHQPLNVLILCEQSGTEREAFASRGHYAMSVDIAETTRPTASYPNGGQSVHHVADAWDYLPGGRQGDLEWDLVIAHPMCTYLTNSGVRWLFEMQKTTDDLTERAEKRWEQLAEAMDFFNAIKRVNTRHLAIENPIPHKHSRLGGRRTIEVGAANVREFELPEGIGDPTQTVQPWMFGHLESKATSFWLKDLPELVETNNVRDEMRALPKSQTHKVHMASPGPDRWMQRSMAFQGLADAMADQWGSYVQDNL